MTPRETKATQAERDRYARYRQTDKYRAAQLRYRTSDKWKRAQSLYGKEERRRNPARIGARKAVHLAIVHGMLTVPDSCPRCGDVGRIEAHHLNGYELAHWFDVEWACPQCHKDLHWASGR